VTATPKLLLWVNLPSDFLSFNDLLKTPMLTQFLGNWYEERLALPQPAREDKDFRSVYFSPSPP